MHIDETSYFNKGRVAFHLLLDVRKAFETVDHDLQTMYSNRKVYIFILQVKRGVPQSSVIYPLFFPSAENDLPDVLNHTDDFQN